MDSSSDSENTANKEIQARGRISLAGNESKPALLSDGWRRGSMRPAVRIAAGAAAGRRLRMDEIVIALDRLLALAAARLGPAATGHERHERTPIELAAWLHCIFPWACFASA